MTTINHYINRYKTDQEFKYDVDYFSFGIVAGIFIISLLYIGTVIGFVI